MLAVVRAPSALDLSWSGNKSPYSLYRSTDCRHVLANFLTTTSSNEYFDTSPPTAALVCYSVFSSDAVPVPPDGDAAP